MARRQLFARFGGQDRLPGASSRARRNAGRASVQQTAGAGLQGDRQGRHTLQVDPDSFLYVGPNGISARVADDLEVVPGSPRRLGLGAGIRESIDRLRADNARLVSENAALRARVTAQEAEAVVIQASVSGLDARLALIEGGLP